MEPITITDTELKQLTRALERNSSNNTMAYPQAQEIWNTRAKGKLIYMQADTFYFEMMHIEDVFLQSTSSDALLVKLCGPKLTVDGITGTDFKSYGHITFPINVNTYDAEGVQYDNTSGGQHAMYRIVDMTRHMVNSLAPKALASISKYADTMTKIMFDSMSKFTYEVAPLIKETSDATV